MILRSCLSIFVLLIYSANSYCQVGIGTTNPTPAAMLEVSSQTDGTGEYRGFMPPRVPDIAARDAIAVSVEDDGLMVYVQNSGCLQMYNGTISMWENIYCKTPPIIDYILLAKQEFETITSSPLLILNSVNGGSYKTTNGDYPNSPMYAGGSRAYGSNSTTTTVILGPIDASENTTLAFKLRLAAFSTVATNGLDHNDTVTISFSTNGPGGAFSDELIIRGAPDLSPNSVWGFEAEGNVSAPYNGFGTEFISGTGNDGISYLEVTGIPNSSNLAIKIVLYRNDNKEIWVIDDAEIWGN